jgi:hypothetical protein
MSWYPKAQQLVKRLGAPAKFAAKLVLGTVVPGSSVVIDLIEKALDYVHNLTRRPAVRSRCNRATCSTSGRWSSFWPAAAGARCGRRAAPVSRPP